MSADKVYPIPAPVSSTAHINAEKYKSMYQESIDNPERFWAEQAEEFITWYKKWDNVRLGLSQRPYTLV